MSDHEHECGTSRRLRLMLKESQLARGLAEGGLAAVKAQLAEAGVAFLLQWMRAKNPMLGDVAPLELLDMGRGEKLAAFIRGAIRDQAMTNDRLLELAEKAGVETARHDESCQPGSKLARPRLDIAHDLLAAMRGDCGIHWQDGFLWRSYWAHDYTAGAPLEDDAVIGTFEECVIALAERELDKTEEQP